MASLLSPGSRRCYEHSIAEFIGWYCAEPRLGFKRAVVTRYRMHLESRGLAAGTVNLRLAAVRRLAYEAADTGLLSPEQAAGIRRVKVRRNSACVRGVGFSRTKLARYGICQIPKH